MTIPSYGDDCNHDSRIHTINDPRTHTINDKTPATSMTSEQPPASHPVERARHPITTAQVAQLFHRLDELTRRVDALERRDVDEPDTTDAARSQNA